ncbi:MAG: DHHA1 domain-containing protein, partial [Candidatus Hodarchaeota archaeon]
ILYFTVVFHMNNYDKFLSHILKCKDKFINKINKKNRLVFIITHHDADGISAGSIVSLCLKRQGIPFQTRVINQISEKYLGTVILDSRNQDDKFYIFTDFGSGQLKFILENFDPSRVMILDHHEIEELDNGDTGDLIHVNPWMFDIDGATEISASGVAYLFAKSLDSNNTNLAPLAIIGSLGDMQDQGNMSSLLGLNRTILDDGIKLGLVSESVDLRFFGRFKRPIHLALSYTTDPFIPGLSGDESACVKFLQKIKIPLKKGQNGEPRTISDLSKDEKSKLVSSIIEWSLKYGIDSDSVKNLIGNIYLLEKEDPLNNLKDVREFASLLNSCGRLGFGGIGVSIAMGDRNDTFLEGQQIIQEYRKKLSNYIEWVQTTGAIKKMENIQVIEGRDYIEDTMIGTLTSILMSSKNVSKEFPLIGWSQLKDDPAMVKISSRGFSELVKKGLDLGKAIKKTLENMNLDFNGGGHAPAAGTELPKQKLDKFLRLMSKYVSLQLNSKEFPKKDKGSDLIW